MQMQINPYNIAAYIITLLTCVHFFTYVLYFLAMTRNLLFFTYWCQLYDFSKHHDFCALFSSTSPFIDMILHNEAVCSLALVLEQDT